MTLSDAAKLVFRLNEYLNKCGWIVALYGSTLDRVGRDIDILIVNKYPDPKITDIIYYLTQLGFQQEGEMYHGIFADSFIFVKDRTVLDINTDSAEGKMLFAALTKLTVTIWSDKTPEEAIKLLNQSVKEMYFKEPESPTFLRSLESLLNRYSKENVSNTPDFLIANYLNNCLDALNGTIRAREKFYGR